jgi:hypothetical protein
MREVQALVWLVQVPVVSGVLELVGIFVSSWFVYRYLIFGPGVLPLARCFDHFSPHH